MNAARVGVIAAALSLCGCVPSATLMRWSNDVVLPEWKPPVLTVTSQPADSAAPFSVKSLPDHAAAAYITALAAGKAVGANPAKLRGELGKAIKKAQADYTKFDRVLVVDVQRSQDAVRPGDRYLQTNVEVKPQRVRQCIAADPKTNECTSYGPPALPFLFSDYQVASTNFTTVNVGTITLTNQYSASLAITPTIGGAATSSGDASAGLQSTISSTHNISEQPQLSVNAQADLVAIVRTSGEGTDLVGNTLVKLSLKVPESRLATIYVADTDLVDDDGLPKPPATPPDTEKDKEKDKDKKKDKAPAPASIDVTPVQVAPSADLSVCARVTSVDRVVQSPGAKYRDEGKQDASLKEDTSEWKAFPVMKHYEMPPFWILYDGATRQYLDIDRLGQAVDIYFDDYDNADQFADWLKLESPPGGKIGKRIVGILDPIKHTVQPLKDYSQIQVRRYEFGAPESMSAGCE